MSGVGVFIGVLYYSTCCEGRQEEERTMSQEDENSRRWEDGG